MALKGTRTAKGFNQNNFELNKEPFNKQDYSLLNNFAKKLAPFADTVDEPTIQSLVGGKFSTRQQLHVDAGRPLIEERLVELQTLASEDQQEAIYTLAALNDRPRDTSDPYKHRDMLHRCAVYASIRQ